VDAVTAGSILELPGALDALVARVRARVAGIGRPAVVAVAGGSSTGKSTFVAAPLAAALGPDVRLVAQDMHQRRVPVPLDDRWGWDDPANFGVEACLEAVERFHAGLGFSWPRYRFAERRHDPPERIEAGRVLVLEGLYAARGPLREAVDAIVYVEAPAAVRLIRRILRNQYERYPGLAVPGQTAASFLGRVSAAHRDCVRAQRAQADWVVRTARAFVHLAERFALAPIPVTPASAVRRGVPLDGDATLATVTLPDGAVHLRVDWRGHYRFDAPLDAATAEAFDRFDPEAL
jgi:uridine kinase